MSKPNFTKEHYSDISFTESEISQLSSKFLNFSQIWNLTISLIKNNFRRGFLVPILWQLATLAIGFLMFCTISFGQISNYEPQNSLAMDSLAQQYQFLFQVVPQGVLIFLISSILVSLITIRQNYILNHKSISGIWQINRGFYIEFLKLIGISILFGLAIGIIGATVEGLLYSLDTEGNISSIVVNILQIVLFGYFGLYSHLIMLENQDILDSLQISLNLMKPIFWKNILRWLIFNLINGLISIVVYFAIIRPSLTNLDPLFSPTYLMVLLIVFLVVVAIVVALSVLQTAFTYTSFINIRLSSAKHELMTMTENQKDAMLKEMPTLEEETPPVIKAF